jgi:prevent-host-death family protein
MINIRPVSDLRNKFTEIESVVNSGNPVYLTKNGYGTMVVMSLEQYSKLTEDTDMKLKEAEDFASSSDERLSHNEVFDKIRGKLNER